MPKLRHNFVQGKMNKDLDERLVPNGQYRDALNIQIASSEGSDVGAIENVLGNAHQLKKTASVNWAVGFGMGSPKCIGVAKDTLNDKIYWFVAGNNADVIFEYDQATGFIVPVIADARTTSVLNFSKSHNITGVNILDGMLFWTDDYNEPRKINISDFKAAAATSLGDINNNFSNSNRTTEIYGRDFLASDITVIRPAPKLPVTLDVSSTALGLVDQDREPRGVGVYPINLLVDLTDSNNVPLGNGDTKSIGWETTQAVEPLSDINNKDVLLSHRSLDAEGKYTEYFCTGTLSSLTGINVDQGEGPDITYYTNATLTIDTLSPNIPTDGEIEWEMIVVEDDAIFKNNFPRFSYRWKYVDGEYSTYAPFSKAAFIPGEYKYESENAFNEGMDDNIRKITLNFPSESYAAVPKDVKEIEILYKGVDSNNVYVIDKHKTADGTLSSFEITKDMLGPVVESLQLLRLYDDVPRKAKSQEIIGNRLVYGNYLHNYPFVDDGLSITGSSVSTAFTDDEKYIGQESVKSNRQYQLGISFLDEYSRESPVFTTKEAAVSLQASKSETKNELRASTTLTNTPTWAEYFKYYVKAPGGEYYNLSLDRFYQAKDGAVWLSFPSADRNKVREGQNMFLKKEHGSNEKISLDNKFKILDISNEAPDFIKRTYKPLASSSIETFISNSKKGFKPSDNNGRIIFEGPRSDENQKFFEAATGAEALQFEALDGTTVTDIYDIKSGGAEGVGSGAEKYRIRLEDGVEITAADSTWLEAQADDVVLRAIFYEKEDQGLPEFQGRFFVKIAKNAAFVEKISKNVKAEQKIYIEDSTANGPERYNNTIQEKFEFTGTAPYSTDEYNFGQISGTGNNPIFAYGNLAVDPDEVANGPGSGTVFRLSVLYKVVVGSTVVRFSDENSHRLKFFNALQIGKKIRFVNSEGVAGGIYIITSKGSVSDDNAESADEDGRTFHFKTVNFGVDRTFNDNIGDYPPELQIVEPYVGRTLPVENPAVFETEPVELADLDIYYEATGAQEIADLGNTITLDFKNCYAFGNGVESDRIRDDFNAPQIGKGVRVSTVLQTPYYEERLPASLIYSGIVNSRSGVNNSNQFTTAIDITKDLPNTYGGIQKLYALDTNLLALCEDKVFKILANKDALFNADGNTNITSSSNVLGQTIPVGGEFGISKNPESFANFGFRSYFTDKSRGTVLRLSADGLTEIADKGMSDYFEDKFKSHSGAIIGSYDEASGSYNVTLSGDETVSFKERVDGWPTRLSFTPEFAISLNNEYYTIKNGSLWKHNSSTRSNFYDIQEDTTVTLIINDNPSAIKNFKTLSYEGDDGWTATIDTDQQSGTISTWDKREGLYYNFISGKVTTDFSKLDTSQFALQGLGDLASDSTHSSNTYTLVIDGDINKSLQIGDKVYKFESDGNYFGLGSVASINTSTNTVTSTGAAVYPLPINGDFIFFLKDEEKNTSGLIGYYGETKMSTSSGDKKELFAVNSEAFISSE